MLEGGKGVFNIRGRGLCTDWAVELDPIPKFSRRGLGYGV